jgi:hypothetical protein
MVEPRPSDVLSSRKKLESMRIACAVEVVPGTGQGTVCHETQDTSSWDRRDHKSADGGVDGAGWPEPDRMVLLGERHLRAGVSDFVEHYHAERNHQGLDNELIAAAADYAGGEGPIKCRERQGGVLKFYYREAA